MNFSLPIGARAIRGDSFFDIVRHFCGVKVLESLRFQWIESSLDLLEIDDVFSFRQFESFGFREGMNLEIIRSLRALLPTSECSPPASFANPLTIPSSLLKQYLFLVDLVNCLESNAFQI